MVCGNEHPFANQKNIEIFDLQGESFILRNQEATGREIFDPIQMASLYGIKIIYLSAGRVQSTQKQ